MSECYDLDICRSESLIASAHADGNIRMWSGRTFEKIREVKNAHDDLITCVKITPDENYIVSTSK